MWGIAIGYMIWGYMGVYGGRCGYMGVYGGIEGPRVWTKAVVWDASRRISVC